MTAIKRTNFDSAMLLLMYIAHNSGIADAPRSAKAGSLSYEGPILREAGVVVTECMKVGKHRFILATMQRGRPSMSVSRVADRVTAKTGPVIQTPVSKRDGWSTGRDNLIVLLREMAVSNLVDALYLAKVYKVPARALLPATAPTAGISQQYLDTSLGNAVWAVAWYQPGAVKARALIAVANKKERARKDRLERSLQPFEQAVRTATIVVNALVNFENDLAMGTTSELFAYYGHNPANNYYKVLHTAPTEGMQLRSNSGVWPDIGVWTERVDPVPCCRGWHVCHGGDVEQWLGIWGHHVYQAEVDGKVVSSSDKVVAERARLVKYVGAFDPATRRQIHFAGQTPERQRAIEEASAALATARGELATAQSELAMARDGYAAC